MIGKEESSMTAMTMTATMVVSFLLVSQIGEELSMTTMVAIQWRYII